MQALEKAVEGEIQTQRQGRTTREQPAMRKELGIRIERKKNFRRTSSLSQPSKSLNGQSASMESINQTGANAFANRHKDVMTDVFSPVFFA